MTKYGKHTLTLWAGLMMSVLALPATGTPLTARFTAYETADFTAEYTPLGEVTTDWLKRYTPLGTVRTTQPSWARNRDIKFEDSAARPGVLTFTHADGKQSIDVIIMPSKGPTINGKEGSAEMTGGTSASWVLVAGKEYKQIPAGRYSDTITVSYDEM